MKKPPGMHTCFAPGVDWHGTAIAGAQVPTLDAGAALAPFDESNPVCGSPAVCVPSMHVVRGEPKLEAVPTQSVRSVTVICWRPEADEGMVTATTRSMVTSGRGS